LLPKIFIPEILDFVTQKISADASMTWRMQSYTMVIRACDAAGNVVETHEHAVDFKEW